MGEWAQITENRFRLDFSKKFLAVTVMRHRFPREAVARWTWRAWSSLG